MAYKQSNDTLEGAVNTEDKCTNFNKVKYAGCRIRALAAVVRSIDGGVVLTVCAKKVTEYSYL